MEEEIKVCRERPGFRGNRSASKEGVEMNAKRLNGGHLILNCSHSGVTPLVTACLDGFSFFFFFSIHIYFANRGFELMLGSQREKSTVTLRHSR